MNVTLAADSPSTFDYVGSDGKTYPVTVTHDAGFRVTRDATFHSKVGRKTVAADTWEKFEQKVESEIRVAAHAAQERAARNATKAAAPATTEAVDDAPPQATLLDTGETVTVRGMHNGRRDAWLITRADGTNESVEGSALAALFTPQVQAQYRALKDARETSLAQVRAAKADPLIVARHDAMGKVDLPGLVIEARLDQQSGKFVAEHDGQRFAEPTLRALHAAIGVYRLTRAYPYAVVRDSDSDLDYYAHKVGATTGNSDTVCAYSEPLEVLAAALTRQNAAHTAVASFIQSQPRFRR